MTPEQNMEYQKRVRSYEQNPRWQAAAACMTDPTSSPEDFAWALAEHDKHVRSARDSAERWRIGGC